MANFDISKCKYLKSVRNPSQYYLEMIKKYTGLIVGTRDTDSEFQHVKNVLVKKLNGDSLTSPAVLHKICYFTFSRIWDEACKDTPRLPGKPYALEYIATDDDDREYIPPMGFYKRMLQKVKDTIYDPAVQTLLSKPNEYGSYNVIDFDEVSRSIHNAINKYYNQAEQIDERLLRSEIPTEALHKIVNEAITDITVQVKMVIRSHSSKSGYGF